MYAYTLHVLHVHQSDAAVCTEQMPDRKVLNLLLIELQFCLTDGVYANVRQ